MRLSWNEIRVRAAIFVQEWWNTVRESSETHSCYNDFFEIFGVKRRTVARYEQHVRKLDDRWEFIDLFEGRLRTFSFDASMRGALLDACRFDWIADLTDDNSAAYGEAGYTEGLGKPVIIMPPKTGQHQRVTDAMCP